MHTPTHGLTVRWGHPITAVLLISIFCVAGCGTGQEAAGSWAACTLDSEPAFSVGGLEPPDHPFGEVVDAALLPDGRVAVMDRQAKTIDVFARDGSLTETLGGDGEGPGEFRDPIAMDLVGETLFTWDWRLQRVSEYHLDSDSIRTHRPLSVVNAGYQFGVYDDSPYVGWRDMAPTPPTGLADIRMSVGRATLGAETVDTIVNFKIGSQGWVDEAERFAGSPTFGPRGTFAVGTGGVFWSSGDSAVVHWLSAGETKKLEWRWPDRPVTYQHFEDYREQRLEGMTGRFRDLVEKQYEVMPVAEVFPVVTELLADQEDGVWAEIYPLPEDSTRTWLRLTEQGVQCELTVPRSFRLLDASPNWIIGARRDELDVQTVEVWEYSTVESPDH